MAAMHPAAAGESTVSNLHKSKRETYTSLLDSPMFVLEEVDATAGNTFQMYVKL